MSIQEYRICISDTPERLASEVTTLLAQGWELYGHPFAGKQANGNGDRGVCQAMVRRSGELAVAPPLPEVPVAKAVTPAMEPAPVIQAPSAPPNATQVTASPKRTRPIFPLRRAVLLCAILLGALFLFDAVMFRSGYYAQFLDPLGPTGTFERVLEAESRRPLTQGKKEILVVGGTRVAEGFSAKIANEYKGPDGYHFTNCAFPDNPARAWYYFVRDLDPDRKRYTAIAVPIDDYDDPDGLVDPADSTPDLTLLINRLGILDILPFTMSFRSWGPRLKVFRGATLKGPVFLPDYRAYTKDRTERLNLAKAWREHGSDWVYNYEGNRSSLAGVAVDWSTRKATFPPGMSADQQQELTRDIFAEPPQHGYTRDYQLKWLGALADLYRNSQTKVIVFQTPRSPAPRPTSLAHLPSTTVDELRKLPVVMVVDRQAFTPVEKAELFFNNWHLNFEGRKVFSPMLADAVKERVK